MTDLPAPLTPADSDLRDFRQMFIDIGRLFGSTFNARASRNPLAWMIGHKLWYRSWHQLPAGSLPDDDDELCYLAELGFDRASFDSARELAMHGWIKCADGRLYHAVIAEKVNEAWEGRLRMRHRTYCAAIRKHNERNPDDKIDAPSFEQWEEMGRPKNVTRDNGGLSGVTKPNVTPKSRGKRLQEKGTVERDSGEGYYKEEVDGAAPSKPDGANAPSSYAFEGQTIRLKRGDFDQWAKTYHAIPDLNAELVSLDAWFQRDEVAEKRKRWFQTTSGALNKKHQQLLAEKKAGASGGVFIPGGGTPLSSPC